MTSIWVNLVICSLGLGFAIGHVREQGLRRLCFAALVSPPTLIVAGLTALVPPTPPTFDYWTSVMAMSAPVLGAWVMLSTVAFVAGRWSVR